MLRKILWSGIFGVIGAGAATGARLTASRIWRMTTGEEPPAKR
jgi:hypothetical protein